ncbi:MAG: hypothetical protein HFE73_08705 [Firmicutes bacterium]|nr:hypothetical protein [Bacillota bacterium]
MRIKVIMTDKATSRQTMDEREIMLQQAVSSDVAISVDCIKVGPDELDNNTDEAFCVEEMVRESIKAQAEGYDAIVIYCFSDAAIDAIRENVEIPVIGPRRASLALADTMCDRFMVITTSTECVRDTYRRLKAHAIAREKLTSVRPLNIDIGNVRKDPQATIDSIVAVCKKAVEEEYIDGVIFGCLSFASYGPEVEKQAPVKVLDPAFIACAYAEMCVRLGMNHSRLAWPKFTNISNLTL